ncbi:hypothetical protein BAE44_0014398 [Dichanthelium oligosanthes]|uniref:Uncharacterized protein n=1 Tax=Dichanthelium oligosanthes TaxID=888268 RepID=A0A1E5VHH1_9POAL|nr:hypothetical protein BAE44_0014398 [Dichanthelium oligosanthes]
MSKHQGEWILPFHGHGYFDRKLNTWIGLSLYGEEPGHICSCDLASAATSQRRPDVKYTKDDLFTKDPDERHAGATLVYMEDKQILFCRVHRGQLRLCRIKETIVPALTDERIVCG